MLRYMYAPNFGLARVLTLNWEHGSAVFSVLASGDRGHGFNPDSG